MIEKEQNEFRSALFGFYRIIRREKQKIPQSFARGKIQGR